MSNLGNKELMAQNIKRYLDKNGITAKDLAIEIGIPYTTVCGWCQAAAYPRIDKIEKMANFFGCQKADLVEDSNEHHYLLNAESVELLEELEQRPELRELLEVARGMSPEAVESLLRLLRR